MMTRISVCLAVLVGLIAVAVAAEIPRVVNLTGYVRSVMPWIDGAGCHLVVTYADGDQEAFPISKRRCQQGESWLKGHAAGQASTPKAAAAPIPKGPE